LIRVWGRIPKLMLSRNPPPIKDGWGFRLKCGDWPPLVMPFPLNQSACSCSVKSAREEKVVFIPKSTPSWAFAAFTLFGLRAAVSAQPATEAGPPPKDAPAAPPAEPAAPKEQVSPTVQMNRFLGAAIPGANFIASASRMAVAFAHNDKLRK